MKKILGLLIIATGIFASSTFVIENTQLLSEKNAGKIATITKGTKVDILKENGDKVLVRVNGWSYEEAPNLDLYPKYGVTVVLASLDEKKQDVRKIIQTKEDEYEEIWIENSITGWIDKSEITSKFNTLWKKEDTLASQRCSGCHEVPSASHHFPGEFPSLLDSMKEQAGLTDSEKRLLVNYFQKNNIYDKEK